MIWALAVLAALSQPVIARAHGFDERYELPAPLAYFVAGAAVTVALSFLVAGLFATEIRVGGYPDQTMRIAGEQTGEVGGRLAGEGGNPHRRVVQPGEIQPALRGGVAEPLRAPQGVPLVGGAIREVGGASHERTIP